MKKEDRLCPDCKKRNKQKHLNSKWCLPCALERRKRPRAAPMTKEQERVIRKYAGKILKKELAKKAGVSWAQLGRWGRENNVSMNAFAYKSAVIKKVLAYYEKHGKTKTQEKFPEVSVRSIVERHYGEFSPRTIRWTDQQVIDLARFAGIIKMEDQARYFGRPNAHKGSIESAWMKKFGFGQGVIHGLAEFKAKLFVKKRCPFIETPFRYTRQRRKKQRVEFTRILYLWVDMEKHLRSDCPGFVAEAIQAMADFQRWLFGTKYVRRKILKMIDEVGS